jgi:hypothetical protein
MRGGSWRDGNITYFRSASRGYEHEGAEPFGVGFRCAR